MVLSSKSNPVVQVVADKLAIEILETLDFTYQVIPSYDETEEVLARWDNDELQYFVAFSKLPPGWLNADVWIKGFIRDITAASEKRTLKILNKGSFASTSAYNLDYLEVSYVLKGATDSSPQLIHFITDHKNSFLAFTTPISKIKMENVSLEVSNILKTTHVPTLNVVPLIIKNEDKYLGLWVGNYKDKLNRDVNVIFELKKDLTFARKETMKNESDAAYTGIWSISGNLLNWTYLYGKPTSQDRKSSETDEIISLKGNILTLSSEDKNIILTLQKSG